MPKSLPGVEKQILETARRQVFERGYAAMTIRSVAAECGIAVGTIYNYYSSKEMLVAAFMLEDWKETLYSMKTGSSGSADAKSALECIYSELCAYSRKYECVFEDSAGPRIDGVSFLSYHRMLRMQIAEVLMPIAALSTVKNDYLAEFLADAVLVQVQQNCAFEKFYGVIAVYFEDRKGV